MDQWVLYGKTGNPSSDIMKAWLNNNGIPVDENSVFQLTKEEIRKLASIVPGGVKSLVYPDTFSFLLINPQKKVDKEYIAQIHEGKLSDEEIIDLLSTRPALVMTPIVTNYDTAIIGYDLDTLVSTFRFIKVKDVTIA